MFEVIEATPTCKLCDETKLHARGFCRVHYHKWKRGTVTPPKDELAGSPNDATIPSEFISTEREQRKNGVIAVTQGMIRRFLYEPHRAGQIMQRYFTRAFQSDKVLIEYVKMLIPQNDGRPPVQVIINTPLLQNEKDVTYDVEGREIDVSEVPTTTPGS